MSVTGAIDTGESAPMAGWDDDWQRGDSLGDYALVERIGEGGVSRVYEARHRTLGTRVAVKTLLAEHRAKPAVRARFEREGLATAQVHHPNVVRVITVGTHRGSPYLVMEFLTGGDLQKRLREGGAMHAKAALEIMLPVLSAVQEAHDKGLIHRDLKPSNIMLESWGNRRLRPVVVDFGIARSIERPAGVRETSGLLGTPAYMAPEQARGASDLDAKADQYALGAILYECLTGAPAFDGASIYDVLIRVSLGEFAPLRERRPDAPDGLARAIARAMSVNPSERFASVRELGAALLPFADATTAAQWSSSFVSAASSSTSDARPIAIAPAVNGPTTLADAARSIDAPSESPTQWRDAKRVLPASLLVAAVLLVGALVVRARAKTTVRFGAELNVEPTTARIALDGLFVSQGAWRGSFVMDGRAHHLVIEADGYASEEVTFVNAAPPRLLRLRRRAAATSAQAPATSAVTTAPTAVQQVVATPPSAVTPAATQQRHDSHGHRRRAPSPRGPNGANFGI